MAPRLTRYMPLLAALAVIVALALVGHSTAFRHADSHHYTEAALQMLAHGDWLTPRYGNGEPRLIKPVLTYWMVAASFKLFGVSMFTARLPFILGAGLLVWLTGWLGRQLVGPRAGAWAALVLSSSVPWLLAGLRTIPDVWLCVFLTLSAAGFLGCILYGKTGGAGWTGWLGLGLAVATKGLVGFLPLVAVLVTAGVLRRSPRALFQPVPIVIGLAIGLFWYAAIAWIHGPAALLAFGQDQLHATFTVWHVLKQFAGYWVFLLLAFLPWTPGVLSLGPGNWRAPARLAPDFRPAAWYTLIWTGLLVVVFSFAYQFSGGRYVLPAFPWIAIVVGAVFARARRDGELGMRHFWLMLLVALAMTLGLLGVCVYLGIGTGLLSRAHVALVAAATGAVVLTATALVFEVRGLWKPAGIALVILAMLPLTYWLIRPGLPDTAGRIAAFVRTHDAPGGAPVVIYGPGSLAGVVRVRAPERVRVLDDSEPLPDPAGFAALVTGANQLRPESYPGCRRRVIAHDYRRVPPAALLAAIADDRAPAFLKARRQPYVWVDCGRAPPGRP